MARRNSVAYRPSRSHSCSPARSSDSPRSPPPAASGSSPSSSPESNGATSPESRQPACSGPPSCVCSDALVQSARHGRAASHTSCGSDDEWPGCLTTPTQPSVHPLKRAVVPPGFEKLIHSSPRGKLVRQHPPRAPRSRDVKHGINDFAHVGAARSSSRFGRGNQWYDPLPLRIGHVGGVSLPCIHDCKIRNL